MSIGTTGIELHEFKEKKYIEEEEHGQNRFNSNMKRKWHYSEIFHTQFCFDMFYAQKSSEVEMTLKLKVKTEFPNVLGEYHSNPYIHTVLCDNLHTNIERGQI